MTIGQSRYVSMMEEPNGGSVTIEAIGFLVASAWGMVVHPDSWSLLLTTCAWVTGALTCRVRVPMHCVMGCLGDQPVQCFVWHVLLGVPISTWAASYRWVCSKAYQKEFPPFPFG